MRHILSDIRLILSIYTKGKRRLKDDGLWWGNPKEKALRFLDWYRATYTLNCVVCMGHPEHSLSNRTRKVVARYGFAVGVLFFLWAQLGLWTINAYWGDLHVSQGWG